MTSDARQTAAARAQRPAIALKALFASLLVLLCGCAVNPNTGRNQLMALPAAQSAHANIGYALASTGGIDNAARCAAKTIAATPAGAASAPCPSPEQTARFALQVERIGAELGLQARRLAPTLLTRVGAFQIAVEPGTDTGTASSAGGRIALASSLAAVDPTDDVVAFLIAREMGHVIARHGEENSGARMAASAIVALVPIGGFVLKFAASLLGSQAVTSSWAEPQQREADELALALLERSDRTPAMIVLNLRVGLKLDQLPAGQWSTALTQSIARVSTIALARSRGIQVAATH